MPLIDIRNLTIKLRTPQGIIPLVERLNLKMNSGDFKGLVGESGSGKSLIAKMILGLNNSSQLVSVDRFYFDEIDVLKLSQKQRDKKINSQIAMIPQEAKKYFDPTMTIAKMMRLALSYKNFKGSIWQLLFWKKKRSIELLHRVGIKDHQTVLQAYPDELSEGECQKIMIALALAKKPKLLIADEPTNTMEATTATQIFRLLTSLNQNSEMTILLISHDLNRVLKWCDRVQVLYCGETAEEALTKSLRSVVYHPYTQSLMTSNPNFNNQLPHKSPLNALPGNIPALDNLPIGCKLGPRCAYAQKKCIEKPELTLIKNHLVACHFPLNIELNEYLK